MLKIKQWLPLLSKQAAQNTQVQINKKVLGGAAHRFPVKGDRWEVKGGKETKAMERAPHSTDL